MILRKGRGGMVVQALDKRLFASRKDKAFVLETDVTHERFSREFDPPAHSSSVLCTSLPVRIAGRWVYLLGTRGIDESTYNLKLSLRQSKFVYATSANLTFTSVARNLSMKLQ